MEGAEGFMFMYFHLQSFGIRVVLSFIVLSNLGLERIGWVCGGCVEVVFEYEFLLILQSMNSCILVSY